jgi:hypothetical protein
MKAIKAKFENGLITLAEPPSESGPTDVLVVFPEPADDPWQRILDDSTPRPALERYVREVEPEIAAGRAKPLDLGQL